MGSPSIRDWLQRSLPLYSEQQKKKKEEKKEAAKRATRKLGHVLKDHCSPFSPGLGCIQNCNLTVVPSISSASLFILRWQIFTQSPSPFGPQKYLTLIHCERLSRGSFVTQPNSIDHRLSKESSKSLSSISKVSSSFVREIIVQFERLLSTVLPKKRLL